MLATAFDELERSLDRRPPGADDELDEAIASIVRRARDLRQDLRFLLRADDEGFVFYLEQRGLGTFLRASPVDVSRIVRDAQTLNAALGYEMNTIEFAVQDGVPYAIDFLNPAPDFERERITPHYFELVLEKMTALVIDRALSGTASQSWPRWAGMTGLSHATAV